jgi:hypothetical protein
MKSHMLLLQVVLHEMGDRCCTSTIRDWKTITERVEAEGLSFLTITLPQYCKDFEKSLSIAEVPTSLFAGFAKRGRLPRFLGGFAGLVFDRNSGLMVDEPNIDAIQAIRQICLLFSKVNLECSDARKAAAIRKFIDCEEDVRLHDASLDYDNLSQFKSCALRHLGDVMAVVDRKIHDGDIVPRHGPGATADKLVGNNKYYQNEWPRRLEEGFFPHGEFLFSSWSQSNPEVSDSSDVNILEPGQERPVRVITVPKTLKTPRIIAIEPTCMQYTQQGIMEVLVKAIESHSVLKDFIGFTDQEPNQLLAQSGSITGALATLDLSEASDRVSNQHVRAMSGYFHHFSGALDQTRSRRADVPGYGVLRLAKFASMGSALCFPIEAMVFFTIVLCGIEDELMRPLTRRDLLDLRGQVRIYGDDIIVPVDYVRSVVSKLETFGFRVNAGKSFWTGKFRESCGKEYFNGTDVSVVRVREMLPTQRRHVREIISTTSLRNQMYFAGNWKTASWLDEWMSRLIPWPTVLPTSPALGRHSFLGYESEKECPHLQKGLVRAYSVRATLPLSPLDGYGALLKFFLKRDNASAEPSVERDHLERAGRPQAVNIKLGWVSAT